MNGHKLTGQCKMCGMCCKALSLKFDKEYIINHYTKDLRREKGKGGDLEFCYKNLVQISQKEAFRINPHLEKWMDKDTDRFFFRCRKFNETTNLCSDHDNRPRMCSHFPWYDHPPNATELLYSPDCGYKVDQEQLAMEEDNGK
jgi:Fe-S-cluster containining protein